MNVPLTPIRCLYRGVDLYGKKTGIISGPPASRTTNSANVVNASPIGLLSAGVQPGDRVAYLSFNTNQLLEGYFGPLLAGAIVMPLNVRLTPAELTGILDHAGPRIVIYESDFAPAVDLLASLAPPSKSWVEVGEAYEACSPAAASSGPTRSPSTRTPIAELFYTSGSTGTPKGVMLSHRTLYLHALSCRRHLRHQTTIRSSCTPSRCSMRTAGAVPTLPP